MQFSSTYDGWIGIGFGSNMKNVDMYSVTTSGSNLVKVVDQWATGNSFPPEDSVWGGTNDVLLPTLKTENNWRHISFVRSLNTGDSYDFTIPASFPQSIKVCFCWLKNNPDISNQHSGTKKMTITLQQDKYGNLQNVTSIDGGSTSDEDNHGRILTIM